MLQLMKRSPYSVMSFVSHRIKLLLLRPRWAFSRRKRLLQLAERVELARYITLMHKKAKEEFNELHRTEPTGNKTLIQRGKLAILEELIHER